jgi:hypothetical protein
VRQQEATHTECQCNHKDSQRPVAILSFFDADIPALQEVAQPQHSSEQKHKRKDPEHNCRFCYGFLCLTHGRFGCGSNSMNGKKTDAKDNFADVAASCKEHLSLRFKGQY